MVVIRKYVIKIQKPEGFDLSRSIVGASKCRLLELRVDGVAPRPRQGRQNGGGWVTLVLWREAVAPYSGLRQVPCGFLEIRHQKFGLAESKSGSRGTRLRIRAREPLVLQRRRLA